ncbi:MAG TPA: sialidase family protein [Terriglobales bacterium]|nr:sialidase family protein [Terriglobales bacterium]
MFRKLAILIFVIAFAALAIAADRYPSEKPGPRPSGFYDFWQLGTDVEGGVGAIPNFNCITSLFTQPSIYTGDMLLDCDGEVPHNETTIAVNPNDPNHAVGGYHSYLIQYRGATTVSHVVGATSVTFDGGNTWREVLPPITPYQFTGDPALAFDADGRIYFANIADHEGPGGSYTGPSVVVAYSDDGGLTYTKPITVARGQTAITPSVGYGPNLFNDKEFIAADAGAASPFRNRVYISWTRFNQFFSPTAGFIQYPIVLSYSDDGNNWTKPMAISGFSPYCSAAYFGQPNECDLNQDSYPATAANGTVYVSFENFNTSDQNQAMIVKSTDGGKTWSNPVRIDTLYDYAVFPENVDGRDTLTGCQLRYSVKGNTATDPSDPTGNTVYVVWADNRNGSAAATNTDVFLGRSTDGGATWSVVTVDNAGNDQFYPWVAVAPTGRVDVGYMDRAYSAGQNECKYGFSVSHVTFASNGTPTINKVRVDSGLSDVGNSRWFAANPAAGNYQSRFIGDYNGVAVGSNGATWSLWTDQRAPVQGSTRTGQHAVGSKD